MNVEMGRAAFVLCWRGFVLLLLCCAQEDSTHLEVLHNQSPAIVGGRLIAAFVLRIPKIRSDVWFDVMSWC